MIDDLQPRPGNIALRPLRTSLTSLLVIAIVLASGSALLRQQLASASVDPAALDASLRPMPDFSRLDDVQSKKEAFFRWLTPYIEQENRRIEKLRQQILLLKEEGQLDDAQWQWLLDTAAEYDVVPADPNSDDFWKTLLQRVDVVPVSLALAQAANESGWGTSRFAQLGKNLFGQWCFRQGCGIVPANRSPGQYHEVRKFTSVADSISSYLHNLNTHRAFEALRKLRATLRNNRQALSGSWLAGGLQHYSAQGETYIERIRAIITFNQLEKFDRTSYL